MSVSLEQPFSAVSGPDTTEIEYRDDKEQLNPPSTIEITNDGDKPYQVDHPWIKDHVPVDRDGRIEPTTPVTVAYPRGHDFTMNFEQYLLTIGLNYDRYLTYYRHHPREDRDSDLRRMHQAAIEYRGQTARYLKDKWRKENSEAQQRSQQESTTVHSYIWRKVFDLGIDGLDAEAPWDYRADYLDKCDEFIFIKPDKLNGNSEAEDTLENSFVVGIQRSHDDKHLDISRNPVKYLPEHPEYGPIFLVFIPDIEDLYRQIKNKLLEVLDERLSLKALERGVSQKEYMRTVAVEKRISIDEAWKQELEAIKLSKALKFGQHEQLKWATKLLDSMGDQLEDYLSDDRIKKNSLLLSRLKDTIDAVDRAREVLAEELAQMPEEIKAARKARAQSV